MILITGINGLVGSFVARYFLEEGEKVAGFKRPESDLSLLKGLEDQITWFEGDILDVLSLEEAISKSDYVVHTAAMVSFAPKDRNKMLRINVEGTANVVNMCLLYKVKKLCFVSSVAAIGRKFSNGASDTSNLIDEKAQWEESPLNSNYAKSKYQAELEVWRGVAEGLDAVVVNPSIILGEADWHKSSTQLFKYVYDENKYYTGGTINYVDVQDVAEIIYKLLHSDIVNERFILNGGTLSYKQFFEKVASGFGRKAPSKEISGFLSQIAWRVEALRSLFTGKAPLITKETAQSANLNFIYPSQKIRKELNFEFTLLDETIQRICKNLKAKVSD